MNNIERIIQNIKTKYAMRMDSRETRRTFKKGNVSVMMKKSLKKPEFITINHTAVPLDPDGSLGGEIGEKIESTEKQGGSTEKKSESATESTREKRRAERQKQLREEVDKGLKDGTYSRSMKHNKQMEHMLGSPEYEQRCEEEKWPSYLTIPLKEVEEIAKKYIDTGKVTVKGSSRRVYFEHDKIIGTCVKPNNGKKPVDETKTNCGEIHLSREGWHIVPVLKKGGL